MSRRNILLVAGCIVVASLLVLIVLGSTVGPRTGSASCCRATVALIENINASMNDPADEITIAFVSPASNLEGPPVVALFEDPVWVAANVPGSGPALWLAEGSGHGFAYVANGAARAINFSGIDLGGPPLDGDGEEVALGCAT